MQITLRKALGSDCTQIHKMQLKAFHRLLEKYKDYNTNPRAESLENIVRRMNQSFTDYYFIQFENNNIGVIRVARDIKDTCRIAPMFILPKYQNKGFAQQTIKQVEQLYSKIKQWELDTIKQEKELCHLSVLFPNQNSLIIDAGTCITIDFLDEENCFQGGAILLGICKKAEEIGRASCRERV